MLKAPRPTTDTKNLGFCKVFSSYFLMSQRKKIDQIVVSTLQCVTIISDKYLQQNGIKNQEVPYWQKFLWKKELCKLY